MKLKSHVIIIVVVIFVSLPLFKSIFVYFHDSHLISIALKKHYQAVSSQEVTLLKMELPFLIRPAMAVGGVEQTWEALVNGNLIYSGHYGSEIISLVTDDGHDYMLDKRSISFVPMNTLVDVEDTKGLTTIGAFLYVLIYTTLCVFYIVNLCAVFVKRAIRKKKHAFGN